MHVIKKLAASVALVTAVMAAAAPAHAVTYTYVGLWEVYQGPSWSAPPNGPLAYTGQEAAAFLFGGSAANYAISTNGTSPGLINFEAWYSIIGYPNGTAFAENYSNKYLSLYYGPSSGYPLGDPTAPASAYVNDNAIGSSYTNYAFTVSATPLPSTWLMLLSGFVGLGFFAYRGTKKTSAALAAA
jgi:hypothetical protein